VIRVLVKANVLQIKVKVLQTTRLRTTTARHPSDCLGIRTSAVALIQFFATAGMGASVGVALIKFFARGWR
jgi:branched-subunit amino acid ABC-type transport system permease component